MLKRQDQHGTGTMRFRRIPAIGQLLRGSTLSKASSQTREIKLEQWQYEVTGAGRVWYLHRRRASPRPAHAGGNGASKVYGLDRR